MFKKFILIFAVFLLFTIPFAEASALTDSLMGKIEFWWQGYNGANQIIERIQNNNANMSASGGATLPVGRNYAAFPSHNDSTNYFNSTESNTLSSYASFGIGNIKDDLKGGWCVSGNFSTPGTSLLRTIAGISDGTSTDAASRLEFRADAWTGNFGFDHRWHGATISAFKFGSLTAGVKSFACVGNTGERFWAFQDGSNRTLTFYDGGQLASWHGNWTEPTNGTFGGINDFTQAGVLRLIQDEPQAQIDFIFYFNDTPTTEELIELYNGTTLGSDPLNYTNVFGGAPAPDTTPPEITFYNMTSEGGLGCTNWNTNKQNSCKTSDKTPTVKINLSEPSFCAISTLNLNYTDMIVNDPLTNCTNAPGSILTCNLPDTKAFTSPGLFNISIGCKDEAGNQNRSSTSGNLTINITDAMPPTVTLEKPDNNDILFFKDRPFRFNFTATDDFGLLNMSCRLYFNNTLNQTNSSVKNGTLTNWALINISRNVWQWNVTCTDNSSNTGSNARIVTINNTKPTAPTLQTPANNSGFGNLPSNLPEFTWNNSVDEDNDTITYTIEVNNQSGFDGNRVYFNSSVPQDADGTTGVNVTLPSNDEDAYFWRVRGNDGIENSSFSQTFQFGYANWTIKFNLTSSDTGKELVTTGAGGAPAHFDISCSNGHTNIDVENPHTDTNSFSHGTYNCTFSQIKDTIPEDYRDRTITFTATNDTTIEVVVSRVGGLTEEEHNWLQFLYNCFNSGECIDLLRTINQTTKDIWKRVTGTDTSVVLFENITTNTLSATSNISIDYTIDIPVKEGYAVGALLPLRMFFWITDVNKTKCFNQDKANDTNRAEAPYCLPLIAETLGPNGGQVNFTVDLRPNIPNGDYNVTRSIEIDPIVNNAIRWVNHGQDNIGQIKVIESGNAASYLIKTGESIPEKLIKELTDITGASFITIKLTSKAVKIIIVILSVITITLFGYIIYSKKKDKKLN